MIVPWALALALAAVGPDAPVDRIAPDVQVDNLSAIDLFLLADRARAQGALDDAAFIYDALARDPNPDIRAEARFRKAMMLADARRYGESATILRSLLDEQPHAARVRLEIARVLAAMGDEAGARRELRQVQATGLPEDVAQTVGKFDQILRSRKPLGGTFELAVAPDSNINRATRARTLDTIVAPLTLSEEARAQSGLGLHVAGQGYVRIPVTGTVSVVPRLSGLGNLYRAGGFNDISASGLLGFEWRPGKDRVNPSAGRSWRWYGGPLYARTDTAALDWLHPLGRRAQLVMAASVSRATYVRNPYQNGGIYDLTVSVERAISARAGVSLSLTGMRQTANDPAYSTFAGGITALAWREAGRTSLFLSSGIRRTRSDEMFFLFNDRRREWLVTARAGATLRQLAVSSFAPFFRVTYERNSASIPLYAYSRANLEIGLSRAF